VASTCNITREAQDEFAFNSQRKCEQAVSLRHFDAEIEPIVLSTGKSMLAIIYTENIHVYFIAFLLCF
jgi:acetyl-CoA C-acetyltransferase